ncbi:MAG: TrmJ/YjtD family RNA methyltransferase [Candidatus Ranarchaeia archaeon]
MPKFFVIIIEPEYEANIGYIARTMGNFNFEDLILVNPKTKIGLEARMKTMHAEDVLNNLRIVNTMEEAIEGLDLIIATSSRLASDRNVKRTAITPKELVEKLRGISGNIGILIGREGSGLSNEEIEKSDILVSIPANHKYPVLNISHALVIILYELFQMKINKSLIRKISTAEQRNLTLDFLDKSFAYIRIPEVKRNTILKVFQNLFARTILSNREATTIIGYFHKVYSALIKKNKKKEIKS